MAPPVLPDTPTLARSFRKGAVYYFDYSLQNGKDLDFVDLFAVINQPRSDTDVILGVPLSPQKRGQTALPQQIYVSPYEFDPARNNEAALMAECDQIQRLHLPQLYEEWCVGQLKADAVKRIDLRLMFVFDLWPSLESVLGPSADDARRRYDR